MIERIVRTANGFAEADLLDRQDVARMTFEDRISEVERLRRIWFGEYRAESRLDRVLESRDRRRSRSARDGRSTLLTSIDGVSFEQAWKSRVKAKFVVTPLHVIGRDMLLKNKRAAGRAKDLADVATLETHSPKARRRRKPAQSRATQRR